MDSSKPIPAELETLTLRRSDDDVEETTSPPRSDVTGQVTSRGRGYRAKRFAQKNLLLLLTCLGIVLGFVMGLVVRQFNPSKDALMWIGMPGELFLRMLKLMILPLIVSSVITGTASLDPRMNGKISSVAFTYIVITNTIGCIIGMVLCVLVKPGEGQLSPSASLVTQEQMETQDIFADLFRNVVPDNIVEAAFRKARTRYRQDEEQQIATNDGNATLSLAQQNATGGNATLMETVVTMTRYHSKTDGVNVLGLIVISTLVGVAANKVKDKAAIFLAFFDGATDIVLVINSWLLWFTPVGVASLIGVSLGGVANLGSAFSQLGKLVLVVCVGLAIHTFLVLPAILVVVARRNPVTYIIRVIRPTLIAFAATSTAVAIPAMLESCEKKNGIDPRVARFVIPFCVTMSANGSALFMTSSAIFIAQLTGTDVGAREILIIGFLTAVASLAIPSVPSASIVTLVIILASLNIPANDIALLLAVEWFLDRVRTACNLVSHMVNAAVTFRFCQRELQNAAAVDSDLCDSGVTTTSDSVSASKV